MTMRVRAEIGRAGEKQVADPDVESGRRRGFRGDPVARQMERDVRAGQPIAGITLRVDRQYRHLRRAPDERNRVVHGARFASRLPFHAMRTRSPTASKVP